MTGLRHVASAGVFLAIVPLGLWWSSRLSATSASTRVALTSPLGVAALSVPLAVLAALGAFHPAWIGVACWLLVPVALSQVHWDAFANLRRQLSPWHVGLASLMMAAGVLYAGFPSETPFGFRDEGLYTLGGMALEGSGTLALARPASHALAPELFADFVLGVPFYLPGVYATASGLQYQFSPLLPAWIAQLLATIGYAGLYRVSAVFAVCSIPVFYVLASRFVRTPVALACAVAFALNPAQVWNARINLTEPLTQLLLLAGMLLAIDSLRSGDRVRTLATAVAFGVATFMRLDVLFVPLLVLAAAIAAHLWLVSRDAAASARMARTAYAIVAAQAIALVALWAFTRPYVEFNAGTVFTAVVGIVAGVGTLVIVRHFDTAWLRTPVTRSRLAFVAIAGLLLLFAYAAFVRPYWGPFAIIDIPVSVNHGLRDFREAALPNLAAYVTWPILILALAGACMAAARVLQGRAQPRLALLAVTGIGAASAFVINPQVSPDHFWAIRRFVPLVIPLVILLAGLGIHALLPWLAVRRVAVLGTALSIAAGAALLYVQRDTLLLRQGRGVTAQLRDFVATLPDGPILTRDVDGIATTLLVGFGRPVLPLRGPMTVPGASRFFASCPVDGCTLVYGPTSALEGVALQAPREVVLERQVIAPTTAPLARQFVRDDVRLKVARVRGVE